MILFSRAFWVRVHRYVGLATAVFLFIAGVTGAVIAFADEIDAALNASLLRVPVRAEPVLGPDALARAVEAAEPQVQVNRVFLKREPGHSVRISVSPRPGRGDSATKPLAFSDLYVDPYDGRILGDRQWQAFRLDRANLIPFLFRLHYALHLPGKWGVWLMGAVSLLWTLDCFVGFYLTLPKRARNKSAELLAGQSSVLRKPSVFMKRWKPAWQVNWWASSHRLHFDLHRAAGLWLWIVLLPVAMSGVYLNLRSEVFLPVVSTLAQVTKPPASQLPKTAAANAAPAMGFERAVHMAGAALPLVAQDFEPRFVTYMRRQGVYRVGFQEPGWRKGIFKIREEQVYLDARTGRPLARASYDEGTAADKFLAWQYPLHSGEIFGFYGRLLVGISGVAVALLSVTGVVIWWRRWRAREYRRVS
ncbi:PepSY-associated TM helix domain-containing protein [Ottowia thiooxydans]|uniref:PepSY-associated TM helix domain-containing protein n=1 Tax=Ottowia thiooxydans TaxID=219182 RepID=UPI00040D0084|nr:PepSY-associated TM helix domain-containing protein [Ottowia thiooxydans]